MNITSIWSSHWWWKQKLPLNGRSIPTRLHRAIFQKTAIFVLVAMKAWNLTSHIFYIICLQGTPTVVSSVDAKQATSVYAMRLIWTCLATKYVVTDHYELSHFVCSRRNCQTDRAEGHGKAGNIYIYIRVVSTTFTRRALIFQPLPQPKACNI
jgi:hypothetical protein